MSTQTKSSKCKKKTAQFFEQTILFHTDIKNKNIRKSVCKIEFFKKYLVIECSQWLNMFNWSYSYIRILPSYFLTGLMVKLTPPYTF